MKKQAKAKLQPSFISWRFYLVLGMIALVFLGIGARASFLQVIDSDNLRHQGDLRSLRTTSSAAHRGLISDRNGSVLAVSVPVKAVWADPKVVHERNGFAELRRWQALADVLDLKVDELIAKVKRRPKHRFVYLQRQVSAAQADYIDQLKIPGIYQRPESRRYYPSGEVAAHLIGFTNIDDQGQDGIEKSFNDWLTGEPTKQKVRKSRDGKVVERLSVLEEGEKANDLVLSIDQRIQSLAYKELKIATEYHKATSGSVVVLDVNSGEVLAMVNTPSFNPNNRRQMSSHRLRNRAITDTYEPGSTVKPLVVLSALDNGTASPDRIIDTSPGWMRLGGSRVSDSRNYGAIDLGTVLAKSSNMGVSKLALEIPLQQFLGTYYSFGFGSHTGIQLEGENPGLLRERRRWSDFEIATLSFGYGLTVTPLQLAQAYAIVGNGGVMRPVSLLKQNEPPAGEQVISRQAANQVLAMMEGVTSDGGTGTKARVAGYRVAGKSGTSRKAVAGGYGDEYVAIFAGLAPLEEPRVAIVVLVNEPQGDKYYGGDVAGPVFANVMAGSLQLLNVAPTNTVVLPKEFTSGGPANAK